MHQSGARTYFRSYKHNSKERHKMKEIKLYDSDKITIIDDEFYDYFSKFTWYLSKQGYVIRCADKSLCEKRGYPIRMHREVLQPRKDKLVDHINGNKLDNRKENLRTCTKAENRLNSKMPTSNTSGYKGVGKYGKKWYARISHKYQRYDLGTFDTPELAAEAYNEAATRLFGEFASLNPLTNL